MSDIALFCTTDPLGARDTTYLYFGLTLSAGVEAERATAAEALLLKPWTWEVPDIHLYGRAAGGPFSRLAGVEVLDRDPFAGEPAPQGRSDDRARLVANLEALWAEANGTGGGARFGCASPTATPEGVAETSLEEGAGPEPPRPWHLALAEAAAFPYPYAQWLKLSWIVRVPAAGATAEIVALPVVRLAPAQAVLSPTGAFAASGGSTTLKATYAGAGAAIRVNGYTDPVPRAPGSAPVVAPTIDPERLWIRVAQGGVFGSAWSVELHRGALGAFDLPQRLIDALRRLHAGEAAAAEGVRIPAPVWTELAPRVRAMIVASLRDFVGAGERPAAPGPGAQPDKPDDSLLGTLEAEVPAVRDLARSLRAAARGAGPLSLAEWVDGVLRPALRARSLSALPGGGGSAPEAPVDLVVLEPDATRPEQAPAEMIAELQQLHDLLQEPGVLKPLLLAEWSRLDALSATQKTQLGDAVEALGGGSAGAGWMRARHLLAAGGIGPVWRAWIGGIDRVADPKEQRARLVATLPQVLAAYAESRFGGGAAPLPAVAGYAPAFRAPAGTPLPPWLAATLQAAAGAFTGTLVPELETDEEERLGRGGALRLDPGRERQPEVQVGGVAPTGPARTSPRPPGELRAATPVPHALSVQVLPVRRTEAEVSGGEAADPLRRYAGFAVMMGKVENENRVRTWRCLNYAEAADLACLDGQTTIQSWKGRPLLVGPRLAFTGELSETLLTYDNVPLVAHGPLARMNGHALMFGADAAPAETGEARPFRYSYVLPAAASSYQVPPEWVRIPMLVFGERYEVAAFALPNSGALPVELQHDAAHPARIRLGARGAPPPTLAPPATGGLTVKVWYPRRVAVGQVRLAGTRGDWISPPSVPDELDVALRARELFAEELIESRAGEPLLLLAPEPDARAASSWSFALRPPSTDLQTWLRWKGSSLEDQARAGVVAEYHARMQRNHARHRQNPQTPGEPMDLDDPAVTAIGLVLQEFDDASNRWNVRGRGLPIPLGGRAYDPEGLRLTEAVDGLNAARIQVDVRATPAADGITQVGDRVQVAVAAGKLYRLVATPLLTAQAAGRFDPEYAVGRGADRDTEAAFGPSVAYSPWTLMIEVATPRQILPGELRALWNSLRPAFEGSVILEDGSIPDAGRLRLTTRALPNERRLVNRVNLHRQRWTWQGRELPGTIDDLPGAATFESAGGTAAEQEGEAWRSRWLDPVRWAAFEAREFGQLSDVPRDDDPMEPRSVSGPAAADSPQRAATRVQAVEWTQEIDLAGDRRADYYRFALSATHRYAGLYPGYASVKPWYCSGEVDFGGGAQAWVWRSFLIPCRPAERAVAPRVRAVLPLIHRDPKDAAPSRAAGLMTVVEGPAYASGGLAERFRAEVMDAGAKGTRPALAPKPTLSAAAGPESANRTIEVTGPVGHTFRPTDPNPWYHTTSYLLNPPRVDGLDLSWYYLRPRFARHYAPSFTLRRRGAARTWREGEVAEWTEGHWVELLPEAHLVPTREYLSVEQTELRPDRRDPTRLTLWNSQANAAVLSQLNASSIWEPLLLVTQRVTMAAGNRGAPAESELYIGLWRRATNEQNGTEWRPLDDGVRVPEQNAYGRIVTVEGGWANAFANWAGAIGSLGEASFWDALFPRIQPQPRNQQEGASQVRRRMRIISITEPIRVVRQNSGGRTGDET
ncbi:MAG TPA: hypothetical protein VF584_26595 [Longimicrobium sp.]|jgi:hypothetical protein